MNTVNARLGKTHYELSEQPGEIVRITRINDEGPRHFYVPKVLIRRYVAKLVACVARESFVKMFGEP